MNDEVGRGDGLGSLPADVKRLSDELLQVGKEYGLNSPQALVCKRRLIEAVERAARARETSQNGD